MVSKNKKIATFIALLHLLVAIMHSIQLNYSIPVGCCHFYVLRSANGQPVRYSVTIYSWILTPYIDIEFVVL